MMNDAALARLRNDLAGVVLAPGDPDYDTARRVHNGLIDRSPTAVVRCAGTADVAAAIRFAGEQGLPVAVRGGGHSVAGHGTCDDGLLVDLSRLRAVQVDPAARVARVQGGATLADLDRETQVFGLATPTGQVSATGIGGLTLNGGLGMLQRKYGLTCDNLRAAEVVTAAGEVVHADRDRHTELFWALRGGGGNFGAVTWFEFDLHPIGPTICAGLVAFPVEQAPAVLHRLSRVIADAPRELSADAIFQHAPPLEIIPEEMRGSRLVGIFVRYAGPLEECQEAIDPIRQVGTPVIDTIGEMPYVEVQSLLDEINPPGLFHYWSGEYVPTLDAAADILAEHGARLPTHASIIEVIPFNAAPTEVPADATAFAHREESWLVHILAQWIDAADETPARDWARRTSRDLRAHGRGEVYLNLVTDDEDVDRVRAFWNDKRMARLQAVKDEYDPGNMFRFNHNIPPSGAGAPGPEEGR
jgi:FAD/FMN-containing dehydrogenase